MPRKRGQGEGCITKRKDGSWASVITVGKNSDGTQKRRFFYGKTRQEVAEKLNKALNELNTGMYVDINKITVSDWLNKWLYSYKLNSIKPKTFESYNYIIQSCIMPFIGNFYLQDLNTDNIQSMLNKLIKKNLSSRTIKYTHTVLHSALEQAFKNSLITKNSSNNVALPKKSKKEIRILSIEEQTIFLNCVKSHRLNAAFILLLSTGIRVGELLALSWDNVNIEEGTIRITQNVQRIKVFDESSKTKTKLIFGTPKTDKGIRTIPLLDSVINILIEHKKRQANEQNKAGEIYKDNNLVFCTEIGTPIEPRNLTRTFKGILKKANLEDINLHALRHTFATRGLESGIELKVMQELLGHSSISVTGDIYSHVLPEKKKESINKLRGVFKNITTENDNFNSKK